MQLSTSPIRMVLPWSYAIPNAPVYMHNGLYFDLRRDMTAVEAKEFDAGLAKGLGYSSSSPVSTKNKFGIVDSSDEMAARIDGKPVLDEHGKQLYNGDGSLLREPFTAKEKSDLHET